MISASQDFINAMSASIKQMYVKLEIYDSNMNYIKEITQQTSTQNLGYISVQTNTPIRRSFTFSLVNNNNEFDFGDSNLIWLDKRFKLYIGLKLKDGSIEYVPQGVYVLTAPQDTHNLQDGKRSTIQGQDKAYLLTGSRGQFVNDTTIATGAKITDVIKTIASDVGETMFNFDSITTTVPYEITYSSGSSRFDALTNLATLAQCDIYYDENGYLRLKQIDLNSFDNDPVEWTYEYGSPTEVFYAGNVRKLDDSNMCNYVRAVGGSSQTGTVSYDLVVDENNSIFANSPYSIQKIGTIFYAYNNGNADPSIITVDDAKFRCKYMLMQKLGFNEQIEIQISPNFLHSVNTIIEIIDNENSVNGKYLIQSMQIPLVPQLMTIDCVKYIKILDDWNAF